MTVLLILLGAFVAFSAGAAYESGNVVKAAENDHPYKAAGRDALYKITPIDIDERGLWK